MNNLFHQSIYDVYSMVSIIKFNVKSYFRASLQLEKDDDFVKFINPCTRRETSALGDPNMRNLKQGEIIQLERKGYYRCDVPFIRPSKPIVLFAIPDGQQQPPAN
jgi:glutamyl-tRNA synthetase